MATDDDAPGTEEVLPTTAGYSVEVELARALSAAQRQIHWLREERDRLRAELGGESGGEPGDAGPDEAGPRAFLGPGSEPDPGGHREMLQTVLAQVVPEAARRLAVREAAGTETWDRLTEGVRDLYLVRARAAASVVAQLFDAAIADIPGLGEVRRAQLRLGLPPSSDLAEVLEHVRAESRAQALQEVADDLRSQLGEHETARLAVQAVELVVVEGEQMAAQHASPVAVEVAQWFTRRLQQALAAADVTLGDALEAEREQVLLAVAGELGLEGMDALAWYSDMSTRLDAALPSPDA